jgi:ArsR family transcriptional regulator
MAPSSNQAFKAISDPTRREILRLLRRGEMTAGDLAERFDMTKPTMSHHFSVLKEADLLTSRRDGQQIWYGLNTTVVQDLMAWAMDLMRSNDGGKTNELPKEKSDGKKPKWAEIRK